MTITFLGAGAAQGYPNPFCRCDNCERARALGGRSLRKRCSALVNDDLLIDLGPDLISSSFIHGCSLGQLRYCLQTHPHADHLDPSHILSRSPEYGVPDAPRLRFYASSATVRRVAELLEPDFAPASFLDPEIGERMNFEVHEIEPMQPFTAGPYRVTAVPARHGLPGESLIYMIEAPGQNIFYGTDTGTLPEETWRAMHQQKSRFDVVILDHSLGYVQESDEHLNAHQLIEHMERMRDEGLLSGNARVFATHLAHGENPPHEDLAEIAARHGYEVAYDGLTV